MRALSVAFMCSPSAGNGNTGHRLTKPYYLSSCAFLCFLEFICSKRRSDCKSLLLTMQLLCVVYWREDELQI